VAGLSVVILLFGAGSPLAVFLPPPGARRLVAGFLFGTIGALIATSPLGKASGAHLNPAVTLAFWLKGTIGGKHALAYVVAQLTGAVVGCLPLLAWGAMGQSVEFGATLPGAGASAPAALFGEAVTTLALVLGLFLFLGHRPLRPFTPLLFPFLYATMVFLEAPISGTSTNPARSLGPAVVAAAWRDWWVYWLGPLLGTLAGAGLHGLPLLRRFEVEVAKLYHFDHDPHGVFGRRHRDATERASG
jgi:aquaporin Z